MLTNRNIVVECLASGFGFRTDLIARISFILGGVAALLFAFQLNLRAQSSSRTVQPSAGLVGVGTTHPNTILHIKANSPAAIARIEQTAINGGAALSIVQSGSPPREIGASPPTELGT
jgi:hypothetical protein